jgi:glutaredoxin-related protein
MSGRIQRLLGHRQMRDAMAPFSDSNKWKDFSTKPGMIGVPCVFSQDLAVIAQTYAELQDARELADYDVVDAKGTIGRLWASDCLDKSRRAFDAWNRVKSTDEARLFLATLIFGVKWANRT